MRKFSLLGICCACILLTFVSCKGCKQACIEKKRTIVQKEKQEMNYLSFVDDTVRNLFGDTISNIVFNPERVSLIRLTPRPFALSDTLKKDSLPKFHENYILKEYALSSEQISSILLLLSDADSYFFTEYALTMPFNPYLALCISKGDDQVDIIFSIGGGRIKIYYKDFISKEIKYIPERLVIKYFQNILHEPMLQAMLES